MTQTKQQETQPEAKPEIERRRLTDEEIEEMRRSFQASAKWMKEQLAIDPELKHL